jgi:hypothetical protein
MGPAVSQPFLSVVVTTRNDDHGGNALHRLEMAIRRMIWQSETYRLPTEYIVVEWNPPKNRPTLGVVLQAWNLVSKFCRVRIIQVSPEIHADLPHANNLPIFQMIAKNVGIRRSQAQFTLATNIDVFLSDRLFARLAAQKLSHSLMYRSDRFDLPNDFCGDFGFRFGDSDAFDKTIRINRRGSSTSCMVLPSELIYKKERLATGPYRFWRRFQEAIRIYLRKKNVPIRFRTKYKLHTNACGDFTLLSTEAWHRLRGYPELAIHSFHLDSIFCIQAHESGIREETLFFPEVHLHLNHSGGWAPETGAKLFENLANKGIPYVQDEFFLWEDYCRRAAVPVVFNPPDWGFNSVRLQEIKI